MICFMGAFLQHFRAHCGFAENHTPGPISLQSSVRADGISSQKSFLRKALDHPMLVTTLEVRLGLHSVPG